MKIIDIEQNSDDWIQERKGRITGSKLGDIYAARGGRKIGYYQLIADGMGLDDGSLDGRDRGHDTELEAIEAFAAKYDKKVDPAPGMWISDVNDKIAISPDGGIKNSDGEYTEAVEVKCLGSARHIEAVITNKVGAGYQMQAIQYFIVNEKLERLYFVFYDPRITARPLHVIEFNREDWEEEIEDYLEFEQKTLAEVDEWVGKLAF